MATSQEFRILIQWLKHAFAVEPPGPVEPTEAERPVVEWLCSQVVERRLTLPALMALEMSRPLNFVGAQAIHFLAPLISALTDAEAHKHLATFLERRGSVEYLCRRIEALESERTKSDGTAGSGARQALAPATRFSSEAESQ